MPFLLLCHSCSHKAEAPRPSFSLYVMCCQLLQPFHFFVILIGNLTLITANVVRSHVIFHISDATCPSQQHHGDLRVVKAHENAVPEGTLPHYLLATFLQLELHLLAGAEMWPFLECLPSKTVAICLSSKLIYSKAYFLLGLSLKHRPWILSCVPFLRKINSQCRSSVKPLFSSLGQNCDLDKSVSKPNS